MRALISPEIDSKIEGSISMLPSENILSLSMVESYTFPWLVGDQRTSLLGDSNKQASIDLVYLCSTHLNLLDRELGGDDPATTFGATFYNEKVDFRALFLVCRRRMKRWFS